ncbi:MAG: hypothetical protein ABI216_05795 [Devosia sp.]
MDVLRMEPGLMHPVFTGGEKIRALIIGKNNQLKRRPALRQQVKQQRPLRNFSRTVESPGASLGGVRYV